MADNKKGANDFLEKKKAEARDKAAEADSEAEKKSKEVSGSKGLEAKSYAKKGEYTDKQKAAREKFKEMIQRKSKK